jgi:hypothetical protein
MKTKEVIDDEGNKHTMLIPENDFDRQIAMGYSVGGIGAVDKSARRKRDRKTPRKNDRKGKVK